MGFLEKIRTGWNAFISEEKHPVQPDYSGAVTYGYTGARRTLSYGGEKDILESIITRISIDVAAIQIRHAKLDDEERYQEDVKSGLNECLSIEANIDQGGRQFRQDMASSLCHDGTIAIVPVDTSNSPINSNAYDIYSLRVGKVVEWYPRHVRVNVYNDRKGSREDVILPKGFVAIVENPLYNVMNEYNSTLQRIIRKLQMLDTVDEYASSGKMDLIIQLPYVVKSEARKKQADQRRTDIEVQLRESKYGIAYMDGTEKITQLNRPVENNLLAQIEKLIAMLYSQLGLTPAVFDGTADEAAMLNYQNRTIEPIVGAIAEAMHRTFLTKTARTQGQAIKYFTDPFKLVPITDIAEIADKFTRNEIVSANEMRSFIGLKPAKDPKADELRNSNMPAEKDGGLVDSEGLDEGSGDAAMSAFDELDSMISGILSENGVEDESE